MKKRRLRNQPRRMLAAAEPSVLRLAAVATWTDLEAAAGGPPKQPTFTAHLYGGGPIRPESPRLDAPVVVDLSSVVTGQRIVANLDHDSARIIGQTRNVHVDRRSGIDASGVVTGDASDPSSPAGIVVGHARNGFEWPVSMGARIGKLEQVRAGASVTVNGKSLDGPLYVARNVVLTHVAFLGDAADLDAHATIAATARKDTAMDFENWLTANGFDPAALNDAQRTTLKAAFDAEYKPAPAPVAGPEADDDGASPADAVKAIRAAAVQETQRVSKIGALFGDKHPEIKAKALAEGLSFEVAENQFLKAENERIVKERPTLAIHASSRIESQPLVLECAFARTCGLPDVEKQYKPETLEAADKNFRHFGIQQLLLVAAAEAGFHVGPGQRVHTGNLRDILKACFLRASGFSTTALSGILGNVANKEILQGYMEEDNTWREISRIVSVTNFHQRTAYRMLDSLEYEQLGPAGEIKHGTLGQESYTYQAKTYAKMLGLTREAIINDDLGAFDDIRTRIGRGGAKKFNNVVWAAFINNSALYTAARTNYISGSTTNLGTDGVGLQAGVLAFYKMTSPTADSTKRVGQGLTPTILLVPPELMFIAQQLFASANVIGGVTNTTTPDRNIFGGKYRPVVQSRLSDSAFTGYSTTAWYLLTDAVKPIVVSFLNGVQTPTVESADADFDTLGIQFRGYHDFGADQGDYLTSLKSKGAA